MSEKKRSLRSGQINFQSSKDSAAYSCVVIRDGVIHNMSEPQRQELIEILQSYAPGKPVAKPEVDLEDMF